MFTKAERIISLRNLRPKKKEGFLKIISIFSFLGIMLGVAILIIVMSVMNGFKTDLTKKILGLNPHIVIESNGFSIEEKFLKDLNKQNENIRLAKTFTGEGIIISNNNAKGIIIKGINLDDKVNEDFLKESIVHGSSNNFKNGSVVIGNELAFNLDLEIGDQINLMSSAFVSTPFGSLPKQETFKIVGIFNWFLSSYYSL